MLTDCIFPVSISTAVCGTESDFDPAKHKWTLLTPDGEKFVPNMTTDDNRMEIRHNWDMLMPRKSQSPSVMNTKLMKYSWKRKCRNQQLQRLPHARKANRRRPNSKWFSLRSIMDPCTSLRTLPVPLSLILTNIRTVILHSRLLPPTHRLQRYEIWLRR
jgi:hypothetical protein